MHGDVFAQQNLFYPSSSLLSELAELPLIRLDFSCNKITEIPSAFRKLRQLQSIILDNNPMQSPPAQVYTVPDFTRCSCNKWDCNMKLT